MSSASTISSYSYSCRYSYMEEGRKGKKRKEKRKKGKKRKERKGKEKERRERKKATPWLPPNPLSLTLTTTPSRKEKKREEKEDEKEKQANGHASKQAHDATRSGTKGTQLSSQKPAELLGNQFTCSRKRRVHYSIIVVINQCV